jgi:hypothetical protein
VNSDKNSKLKISLEEMHKTFEECFWKTEDMEKAINAMSKAFSGEEMDYFLEHFSHERYIQ